MLQHGGNIPGTVRWQLDAGVQQDVSDGVITFTFATWNHGVGLSNSPQFFQGQGYTPFTEAQKAAGRIAVEIGMTWSLRSSSKSPPAGRERVWQEQCRHRAGQHLYRSCAGRAYYPGRCRSSVTNMRVSRATSGSPIRASTAATPARPGSYGLQTLNHELGHSLGLSHPGNYNFGDDNDGDGVPDPITYEGDAFYFQDSHQYSIMSYFDSFETGTQQIDWNLMRFVYPSTPMVHDICVIQQKYGADMTTRTGDTTYGFNATADVTNEAMRFEDDEMSPSSPSGMPAATTRSTCRAMTASVIDLREVPTAAPAAGCLQCGQAALIVDADAGRYSLSTPTTRRPASAP